MSLFLFQKAFEKMSAGHPEAQKESGINQ